VPRTPEFPLDFAVHTVSWCARRTLLLFHGAYGAPCGVGTWLSLRPAVETGQEIQYI
jgi:hypothetical protein